MSEKKRKRESSKTEKPKKKVAIDALPEKIKVSVLQNDGQLCPVVAYPPLTTSTPASGLSLPQDIALRPWKRSIAGSKSYDLHLHSNEHPRLDYTADVQHDGLASNFLKHYIGVFDPATGSIQIMEAQKVEVRSVLRPTQEELDERQKQQERQTFAARRIALGMEFGTKKSKKAIAAVTENAITKGTAIGTTAEELKANPLAAAVLESIAATTKELPTKADVQAAVDASKPRPVPNLAATTPAEVYTIESLIGEQTLRDIPVKEWQEKVHSNEGFELPSRYVAKKINPVVHSGDVKKLKALRYLLMMLDFHAALKSDKHNKTGKRVPPKEKLLERMSGASPALVEGLKRKFSERGELTKWHLDHLYTHVAALTLVIDNYETDFYDVKEDLRLETRQMAQYYHELGCRTMGLSQKEREAKKLSKQEGDVHKMAKLKLPLEFPKVRNSIAKKKR